MSVQTGCLPPPELSGRSACMQFEELREIAFILISKLLRYLLHTLRRLVQPFFSLLHFGMGDIVDEAHSGFFFEQAAEIARIQMRVFRHLLQGDFTVQMAVYILLHLLDLIPAGLLVHLPDHRQAFAEELLRPFLQVIDMINGRQGIMQKLQGKGGLVLLAGHQPHLVIVEQLEHPLLHLARCITSGPDGIHPFRQQGRKPVRRFLQEGLTDLLRGFGIIEEQILLRERRERLQAVQLSRLQIEGIFAALAKQINNTLPEMPAARRYTQILKGSLNPGSA